MNNLIGTKNTVDTKLGSSKIQLFSNAKPIESSQVVVNKNGNIGSEDEEEDEDESENDEDEDECLLTF